MDHKITHAITSLTNRKQRPTWRSDNDGQCVWGMYDSMIQDINKRGGQGRDCSITCKHEIYHNIHDILSQEIEISKDIQIKF